VASQDCATWYYHIRSLKCHMSKYHSSTCHTYPVSNLSMSACPHGHIIVWSYDLYSQLPRHHCTGCIVSIFLRHVWRNKQTVISLAYSVFLSSFNLHWVRIDEAYAHICFESILITLIFRPSWTHFGSLIHSGSHLPTKDLLVLQKVLTSHQVQDRPPHLLSIFKHCPMHMSHQDQL
jgi:hypothetical protein